MQESAADHEKIAETFINLGTPRTSPEQIIWFLASGPTFHHISLEFLVFLNIMPASTALSGETKTNKTKLFSGNFMKNRVWEGYLKMYSNKIIKNVVSDLTQVSQC